MYSHVHPTGKVYEAHPKPVGIAFGGTIGNERIFIDEDFDRVTVRHHAVDKTYRPGSLIPHQVSLFVAIKTNILSYQLLRFMFVFYMPNFTFTSIQILTGSMMNILTLSHARLHRFAGTFRCGVSF